MGRKMKNGKSIIPENRLKEQQQLISIAEKEIYENITQCLCLARLQLGGVELDNKDKTVAAIGEASLLIGKAVKDLRNLAKQLSGKPY